MWGVGWWVGGPETRCTCVASGRYGLSVHKGAKGAWTANKQVNIHVPSRCSALSPRLASRLPGRRSRQALASSWRLSFAFPVLSTARPHPNSCPLRCAIPASNPRPTAAPQLTSQLRSTHDTRRPPDRRPCPFPSACLCVATRRSVCTSNRACCESSPGSHRRVPDVDNEEFGPIAPATGSAVPASQRDCVR